MDACELAWRLNGARTRHDGARAEASFDEALEALKIQRAAAAELMPYFHQRMPQAVHHTGDGARPLVMIFDGPQGGAAAALRDAMSVHEVEPNQRVIDASAEQSYDGGSDGQA
jgi:hypothetical protein